MTNPRRNTDTRAATEAASLARARERALRAAKELRDTPARAWTLGAFSELVMLGHRAADIIESETA